MDTTLDRLHVAIRTAWRHGKAAWEDAPAIEPVRARWPYMTPWARRRATVVVSADAGRYERARARRCPVTVSADLWAEAEGEWLPGESDLLISIEEPGGRIFRTRSVVEFVGEIAAECKPMYTRLRMEMAREALSQHCPKISN